MFIGWCMSFMLILFVMFLRFLFLSRCGILIVVLVDLIPCMILLWVLLRVLFMFLVIKWVSFFWCF